MSALVSTLPPAQPTSLRERTRRAVRAEITEAACQLFTDNGFDATTAEQIASAAGLSRSSFFRYFPSKEEVLLSNIEDLAEPLARTLETRPASENAWSSLRRIFDDIVTHYESDPAAGLRLERLLDSVPALSAGRYEKQLAWRDGLITIVTKRLDGEPTVRALQASALVAAAIACFREAVAAWTATDGAANLGQLVDTSMSTVSPLGSP